MEVVSKGLARSEPQAAEKLAFAMVLCQGTTWVVPQVLQNMVGALAPVISCDARNDSFRAAVRYKGYVDAALAEAVAALEKANPQMLDIELLKRLKTDVVISGSHNDELHLKPYTDPAKHETTIKSFKLPFGSEEEGVKGDTAIVIVNKMLLTGFDAPVEPVMYLDKIIVAHGLLHAIARVNRVSGPAKAKGFVVDYVGVGHHLKKALDSYDEPEQNEVLDVLSFPEEELRDLRTSQDAVMDFLKKQALTDLADHDAFSISFMTRI